MKPRVFISSTYYDLKYLRESLEKLLLNMNFEPVLFEANKVTFEHGKPLDISCFNEVKTCHIMILIIGGRYGSIISDQDSEHEKEIYDKDYTSITKREYETALKENIPTFIFIDKNVYGEFNTYKINREFYENAVKSKEFKFYNVDTLNVFKFIDLVSTKAIKPFEKIEEIEYYLKDQISGMFHLYLESLKSKDRQEDIFDTVVELRNITTNMNTMINEMGKKIIEPEKYEEVIDAQFNILLNFFFEKFGNSMDTTAVFSGKSAPLLNQLVDFFLEEFFTIDFLNATSYSNYSKTHPEITTYSSYLDSIKKDLNNKLQTITEKFHCVYFDRTILSDYSDKIKPLLTSVKHKQIFKDKLSETISSIGLPF